MAADNYLRSYGDNSRVEDVMSLIEYLTPTEDSIFKKIGSEEAVDTVHSTLTDTLEDVAANTQSESGDYTSSVRSTPSRLTNLVSNIGIEFTVSRTQQKIDHYHNTNELSRQKMKAIKEWHNSAEYNLVRSSLQSGACGTNPQMNGIINAISKSTNTTAHDSGTTFSASILRGLMRGNWDNSNGNIVSDIYMGSYLSDIMDSFTNKSNIVNTGTNVKEIINVVQVFETGIGSVARHIHRYIQISGTDATGRILGINPIYLAKAFLEKPYEDTGLSRSGDYDKRAIVGKFTAAVRNQDVNFFAEGFDID